MSRFPGLQFPTSNSGQPQTRAQQRPGANLLQRFFALKGDKLARKGQEFQEDSFQAALDAYEGPEGALQMYEDAKGDYDTTLANYNQQRADYSAQEAERSRLNSFYNNQYSETNPTGYHFGYWGGRTKLLGKIGPGGSLARPPAGPTYAENSPEHRLWSGQSIDQVYPLTKTDPGNAPSFNQQVPSFNYVAPESPGAKTVNKLATMAGLSNQLQEVLPEDARNRNRAPTSFYNIF